MSGKRPDVSSNSRRAASRDGIVRIERERGAVTATLDRPASRNRISAAMARALMELAEEIEDDDSVRMLAITGAGAHFCGGFDAGVDSRLVETLAVLSKPTLAIINGDAINEGLELALAMDIRIADTRAHLAITQLKHGAMPRFGGTQRLPRLAGAAQALKMLLTGVSVAGAEADRIGLVTYVANGGPALAKVAGEVTDAILSRGPIAARLVKEAVLKGYDMTLEQGIRLEEDLYALLQTTGDRAEGVRAFLEKRKPLFKGA